MSVTHFLIGRSNRHQGDHSIVGYDRVSEKVAFTMKVPNTQNALLRRFVNFEPDDPNGYDAYDINYSTAKELVSLLGGTIPSKSLDYFIEPWIPQEHDAG